MRLAGLFLFSLLCTIASGETLGRFDHVRNLPGYITADKDSLYYYDHVHTSEDKIEGRMPSQILLTDYLRPDKTPNEARVEAKISDLRRQSLIAFRVYCQAERKSAEPSFCAQDPAQIERQDVDLIAKWSRESIKIAYDFSISEMQRALQAGRSLRTLENLNSPMAQEFIEPLFQALEVEQAIRNFDPVFFTFDEAVSRAQVLWTPIYISNGTPAANLDYQGADRETQMFSSPATLRRQGLDLSKIDPIESGFWRRPQVSISRFDTTNYNNSFSRKVDPALLASEGALVVEYLKPSLGGVTPKMEVTFFDSVAGQHKRYKLKFTARSRSPDEVGVLGAFIDAYRLNQVESRTEFVANNLAAALGFTVDPTYFKKEAHLYLLNEPRRRTDCRSPEYADLFKKQHAKLVNEIQKNSKERRVGWLFQEALNHTGVDANGCQYVVLNGVSLEEKGSPETEISVGSMVKETFGRHFKREFRAFQLFYAWIADHDTKDSNSEVKLTRLSDGRYKVIYSASDMGASFGADFFNKNTPNLFEADLVDMKKTTFDSKGRVQRLALKYNSFSRNKIWNYVTLDDAKWFARLLGQLTYEQIRSSFDRADYPEAVAEFYTQKLLRRRDQLIQVLGLKGEKIESHGTREVITLTTSSQMTNPKTYKIPGCPECTNQNGELVQIPGKVGPEWTRTMTAIPTKVGQKQIVDHVLTMAAHDFVIHPINGKLQRFGVESKFQIEGIRAGIDSFLPAQYLIENPLKNPEAPFWILEVYRIGVMAGYLKEFDPGLLDLAPDQFSWKAKAQASQIFEFVKVTPVKDPKKAFKTLPKVYLPQNMFGKVFRRITDQVVMNLKPGEVVVSSNYVSFGAHSSFSPQQFLLGGYGPYLALGAHQTLTKRQILVREEQDQIVSAWEDLNKRAVAGDIGLKILFWKVPVFGAGVQRLAKHDRVARFNLADAGDKKILLSNLHLDFPKGMDRKFVIQDRTTRENLKRSFWSLLGLSSSEKTSKKVRIRLDDSTQNIQKRFLQVQKLKEKKSVRIGNFSFVEDRSYSEAISDLASELFLRVNLNYSRLWATRDDFRYVKEKYLPIFPKDFVLFDPEDVNYYLGTLELEGDVIIPKAALQKIWSVSRSRLTLCRDYLAQLNNGITEVFCPEFLDYSFDIRRRLDWSRLSPQQKAIWLEGLTGVRAFVDGYESAQKEFHKYLARSEHTEGETQDLLSKLVKLIDQNPDRASTVQTLLKYSGAEQIHRSVSLSSSLGALPGQNWEIQLNRVARGGFQVQEIHQTDDLTELAEIYTDYVSKAIDRYFYDYFKRHSVKGLR